MSKESIFVFNNSLNEKYTLNAAKIKLTPASIDIPPLNAGRKVHRIVLSYPAEVPRISRLI